MLYLHHYVGNTFALASIFYLRRSLYIRSNYWEFSQCVHLPVSYGEVAVR